MTVLPTLLCTGLPAPLVMPKEPALCSAPVIDNAHILTPNAKTAISDTLRSSLGADFPDAHVLTLNSGSTTSSMTNGAFEIIRQCSSWRGSNAAPKPTLLLFAVSPSTQKAGILYGTALSRPLDGQWERIATTAIEPHLAKGEWVTGIDTGIQVVAGLLRSDAYAHASAYVSVAPTTPPPPVSDADLQRATANLMPLLPFAFMLLLIGEAHGYFHRRRLSQGNSFADENSTRGERNEQNAVINLSSGSTPIYDFDGLAMTSALRELARKRDSSSK